MIQHDPIHWLQQTFPTFSPSLPSSTKRPRTTHGQDGQGPGEGSRHPLTPREVPRTECGGGSGEKEGSAESSRHLPCSCVCHLVPSPYPRASSQQAPSHICISTPDRRHDRATWRWDWTLDSSKMRRRGAMGLVSCRHSTTSSVPDRMPLVLTLTPPVDPILVPDRRLPPSSTHHIV